MTVLQGKTPADTELEERNLHHAAQEMAKYIDGTEVFGFPISASVAPKHTDLSPFCSIDEEALQNHRDKGGGCGCKAEGGACVAVLQRVNSPLRSYCNLCSVHLPCATAADLH